MRDQGTAHIVAQGDAATAAGLDPLDEIGRLRAEASSARDAAGEAREALDDACGEAGEVIDSFRTTIAEAHAALDDAGVPREHTDGGASLYPGETFTTSLWDRVADLAAERDRLRADCERKGAILRAMADGCAGGDPDLTGAERPDEHEAIVQAVCAALDIDDDATWDCISDALYKAAEVPS